MHLMPLNMYGTQRSCRAEIFTCSTTYALFLVHCRDSERILVLRILLDHPDGSCRAVARTVSAADVIFIDDACIKVDNCVSYLY